MQKWHDKRLKEILYRAYLKPYVGPARSKQVTPLNPSQFVAIYELGYMILVP